MSSAQVRPLSNTDQGEPIRESGSFAAHLKTLERKIPLRARYDNFIGGEWVAPAAGRLLRQHFPDHRSGDLPDCRARKPTTSSAPSMRRMRRRRNGAARRSPSALAS